jgi:hypothetical protein
MTYSLTPSCTSMSCRPARLAALGLAVAGMTILTGCRNPFLPSSDVDTGYLGSANMENTREIPVFATDFGSSPNYYKYRLTVNFFVKNKVGLSITSVNMTYADMSGNPVTAYKASGGKTMKFMARLNGAVDNTNPQYTTLELLVIDSKVIETLQDPVLNPKYMNCTLTFRGEDDNGYDVKLTQQFTIKGYGF